MAYLAIFLLTTAVIIITMLIAIKATGRPTYRCINDDECGFGKVKVGVVSPYSLP